MSNLADPAGERRQSQSALGQESNRVHDRHRVIAENVGISPDIEVEHDPEMVRRGRDPQLERAVQEILAELEKNPPKKLTRPKFPKYTTVK